MAHLADIDSEIRVIGKIAAVFIGAAILLFLFISGGSFLKNTFFPTPEAPPAEGFGRLPPLDFPVQDPKNLKYNINTLTGVLPQLVSKMNVYEIEMPAASLVALPDAREAVSGGRFIDGETKISDTTYQWTNFEDGTAIQYNILTHDFQITSDLFSAPPANLTGVAATKEGAYETAINFLQTLGEDTTNLSSEKSTITYLKVQDGKLVGAPSQNEAQYVRVDLFPNDLDKFPVYFPGNNQSLMYFILKSEDFNPKIVGAEYTNLIPNKNRKSDYGLITADQAFGKLKKGNALIFYEGESDTVDIAEVALGYYVTPDQKYFMPVVVFKGNNFLGIVGATQ